MGLGHTGQCPGAWVLKTLWFRNRAERAHPPNHAKGGRNRQFPIPQWLRPSRNRYLAPLLLQGRWLFLPTNCDAFWALQTSTTWQVVTIWRWLTPRSPARRPKNLYRFSRLLLLRPHQRHRLKRRRKPRRHRLKRRLRVAIHHPVKSPK